MKRTSLITNLSIALVLVVISVAVFSADLERVYTTVSAPINSGNKNSKNASFMICVETDTDGAVLDAISAALAAKNCSATFFLAGSWVMKNPLRLNKLLALEFEIGNLGFSGKIFKGQKTEKQKQEILDTHTLVKGMTGVDMKLFTPPDAKYDKNTLKTAGALGYTVVAPSKASAGAKNGDLVLVCPREVTAADFEAKIDTYLQLGFGLVKVSENIVFV